MDFGLSEIGTIDKFDQKEFVNKIREKSKQHILISGDLIPQYFFVYQDTVTKKHYVYHTLIDDVHILRSAIWSGMFILFVVEMSVRLQKTFKIRNQIKPIGFLYECTAWHYEFEDIEQQKTIVDKLKHGNINWEEYKKDAVKKEVYTTFYRFVDSIPTNIASNITRKDSKIELGNEMISKDQRNRVLFDISDFLWERGDLRGIDRIYG